MVVEVLQSKNALASVMVIILYRFKVTSTFLCLPPFFIQLFHLESLSPFSSFVYLSCFWIFLSFNHDCELRLCETFAFFFYFHLSFLNLGHLYSTIRFHLLFSAILIVPFCLLFCTLSFLLHRLSSSIPPNLLLFCLLFRFLTSFLKRTLPILVSTITVITFYWMWRYFTHTPVPWPLSSSFLLLYRCK